MSDNKAKITRQKLSATDCIHHGGILLSFAMIILSVFPTFSSHAVSDVSAVNNSKEIDVPDIPDNVSTWDLWHVLLFAAIGGSITAAAFLIYIRMMGSKREKYMIQDRIWEERNSEVKTILQMLMSSMEEIIRQEKNPESLRIRVSAMLVGCRRIRSIIGGADQVETEGAVIPLDTRQESENAEPELAIEEENAVEKEKDGNEIIVLEKNAEGLKENEETEEEIAEKREHVSGPKYGIMMTRDDDFLARFERIVNDNISDSEFGAEEIGRKLNMSRSSVYRRMKRITDMSIVDYIRMIRLRKSRSMLEEGHGVSETAFACGFGDAGYFSVTFKKEYGISPTQFKKKFAELRT